MKTKSIIGGLAAAGAVALAGCTAYARRYKLTDEDCNTPILGEWQERKEGDFLFYHQPPWSVGSIVTGVDEETHQMSTVSDSRKEPVVKDSIYMNLPGFKYFCWTWNFAVHDKGDGTSRYVTKAHVNPTPTSPPSNRP